MREYKRTHTCGDLRKEHIQKRVVLSGWVHKRRDHGGLIFVDLRDRYGVTQVLFDPKIAKKAHEEAEKLRSEWVISVHGIVKSRGKGLENKELKTGEIEVEVETLYVLSCSETPPFSLTEKDPLASEELRLKYRFLDLRRKKLQQTLQIRHQALLCVRNFLSDRQFLEISTPILAKTTPEGARDYLVPSRIYPGTFYALPQSPQLFKQLLMIAGMDRYFQIASCFRDEDLRADRQPEFSQIDIEMSFTPLEDLFFLVENLIQKIFLTCLGIKIEVPFSRLGYHEVIEKYGTDKPDLRFGMPLVRLDEVVKQSQFSLLKEILENQGSIKALLVSKAGDLSRKQIEEFARFVAPLGLKGLAWMKKTAEGWQSNITKFFDEKGLQQIERKMQAKQGDLVLIGGGQEPILHLALDQLRRKIAKEQGLVDPNTYAFTWVTDFPLFKEEEGMLQTEHHPFTSPHEEDKDLLFQNPLKVRSHAYDLVLNGYEIASGSQRIHDSTVQKKIFSLLGLCEEEIRKKFGFFLDALKFGTPPHLGIALGVERLIMILSATENIRDVVAFPKTQKASDLMLQAPSQADQGLLKELHLLQDK